MMLRVRLLVRAGMLDRDVIGQRHLHRVRRRVLTIRRRVMEVRRHGARGVGRTIRRMDGMVHVDKMLLLVLLLVLLVLGVVDVRDCGLAGLRRGRRRSVVAGVRVNAQRLVF